MTDADLVLGKLDPDNFAGGSIRLHPDASRDALDRAIGNTLSLDQVTAAFGVAEVVDENMANAARVHAVENGEDLADYTMIAFGGAAPLHAGRLCEKLGIDRCLVPVGAGVGSAIGFLRAPFSFEANRSVFMRLARFDPAAIKALLSELESEATRFVRSCDANAEIVAEFKVYMRYFGQGWEIAVTLTRTGHEPGSRHLREIVRGADNTAVRPHGSGIEMEITVGRSTPPPRRNRSRRLPRRGRDQPLSAAIPGTVRPPRGTRSRQPSWTATRLIPGPVAGPAVITERETTIIVPSSRFAVAQPDGCIDMTLKAGKLTS